VLEDSSSIVCDTASIVKSAKLDFSLGFALFTICDWATESEGVEGEYEDASGG